MKKNQLLLISLATFTIVTSVLFFSCKKEESNQDTPVSSQIPAPDSKITGVVTSPNGQVIGSAKVIAGPYNTLSDANGAFTLNVYHGNYTLIIETGNGSLFQTSLNVTVTTAQVLSLLPSQSTLQQVGTLAYIPGNYDNIQSIIIDSLGYAATAITMNDLSNYSLLSGFDALFLNCGVKEMSGVDMDSLKYTNLSAYLSNHGSIYASDFAVEVLTGDGHWRQMAPVFSTAGKHTHGGNGVVPLSTCMSPKLGGFISDSSLCTSKSGPSGMLQGATILDAGIINLLGSNTIDINYDLGGWEVVSTWNTPMNAIITDTNFGALALKSDRFSNEYGGLIFFTTFHNEPQGAVSTDVKNILQYFILNL